MIPSILLRSGRYFDLTDPDPELVSIDDIAPALARLCRFTGHGAFYSVAEHSVRVSYLVPPQLALWGLMHDAAEAYLGDVSAPLKSLLPDYRAIEDRIEPVVFGAFGLTGPIPAEVKEADMLSLTIEKRHVLGSAEDLPGDRLVKPADLVRWRGASCLSCQGPLGAEAMFRHRFGEVFR